MVDQDGERRSPSKEGCIRAHCRPVPPRVEGGKGGRREFPG